MTAPRKSPNPDMALPALVMSDLLDGRITPARGRRLVRFRNCFCGVQSVKFYDGQFLCQRHYEADRARYLQDPKETAANIRECNARCERERYARLEAAGLCVTCGKRSNYESCKRCHECQAKRRKLHYASRGKLIGGEHPFKSANRIFFAEKSSPSNANVDLPDTAAQDSASKSNSPAVSG